MLCPNCGNEVPEGKFCLSCGSPLPSPGDYGSASNNLHQVIGGKEYDLSLLLHATEKERGKMVMTIHKETGFDFGAIYKILDGASEKSGIKMQNHTTQKENEAHCPRCGSTSLSADKKGFGFGKAAVGSVLAGPVGLLAGGIGAKKIEITCLNCGYRFKP